MMRKKPRNTTAAASRWVRVSSSFSPENIISSRMPGWRPKSVRYSIHTPSMATAATASTSQREGSGARLSE